MATVPTQNYPQYPYPPQPPTPPLPPKKSHKLRWVLIGIAGIVAVIAIASNAGGDKTHSATPSTTPSAGVSHGIGSQDASGDVKLGKYTADSVGFGHVQVTVTNHSSKRSDYLITVALESGNGRTQYDTALVTVQNLEPAQSSNQDGAFVSLTSKPPATAKLTLKEVERTASV
jgi:hypothetical protein